MMNIRRKALIAAALAMSAGAAVLGGIFVGPSWSQNAGQILSSILSTDLIQIYRGGTASFTYAYPSQLTSTSGYQKYAPLTGFSYTFLNATSYMELNPSGTLAAGYVTLAPAPSDGARECIFSSQIITAFYLNKGAVAQTVNNAVTSLAANVAACYLYSLSNNTWDRD